MGALKQRLYEVTFALLPTAWVKEGSGVLVPQWAKFLGWTWQGGGCGPEECSAARPGDYTAAAVKDLEGWQALDPTEG